MENDYGCVMNIKVSYCEFNKCCEKVVLFDGKDEFWFKFIVFVFFIGGVIYVEIVCLCYLVKIKECGCNFVVVIIKVFNGDVLFDMCGEDVERFEIRFRVAYDIGGASLL